MTSQSYVSKVVILKKLKRPSHLHACRKKRSTKYKKDLTSGKTSITKNRKKRIFVLGDIILKHINGYDLSNHVENCKGFPRNNN